MMQKLLYIFCLVLAGSAAAEAQRKVVTNADLEKFRQERLRAEADLRENYARLGFSSPEVRAAREVEAARLRADLIDRLREESLERDRLATDFEIARFASARGTAAEGFVRNSPYDVDANLEIGRYYGYSGGGFYPPVYFPGGAHHRRGFKFGPRGQTGYVGGGQFWPQAVRPSRSLTFRPLVPRRR